MSQIEIRNVGPVKHVCFSLNRVNVFIGPQSSGKSTIAKIVSFCSWLEKDCLIHQGTDHIDKVYLEEAFTRFYRMESYMSAQSYIRYEGRVIIFEYQGGKYFIRPANKFTDAVVSKVAYVPAERIVDVLPNLKGVSFSADYLQSFVFDWMDMRGYYGQQNALEILGMGIKYYYDSSSGIDMIVLEDGRRITLSQASSGLQSAVPMYVITNFVTEGIYKQKEKLSFEKRNILQQSIEKVFTYYNTHPNGNTNNVVTDSSWGEAEVNKRVEKIRDNISRTHTAKIVIEEPELNVFPQSQVRLLCDILRKVKLNRDTLTITTHSPYILYGLNNLMLGYLVKDQMKEEGEVQLLAKADSFINPKSVSVWEIKNGGFYSEQKDKQRRIQDEDGLIRSNYFDRVMKGVMNDFNGYLNYYE